MKWKKEKKEERQRPLTDMSFGFTPGLAALHSMQAAAGLGAAGISGAGLSNGLLQGAVPGSLNYAAAAGLNSPFMRAQAGTNMFGANGIGTGGSNFGNSNSFPLLNNSIYPNNYLRRTFSRLGLYRYFDLCKKKYKKNKSLKTLALQTQTRSTASQTPT